MATTKEWKITIVLKDATAGDAHAIRASIEGDLAGDWDPGDYEVSVAQRDGNGWFSHEEGDDVIGA